MSNNDQDKRVGGRKVWILPALVALGIVVGIWQPVGMEALIDWGQHISTSPWFLGATVVSIIVLFTFGLPGSLGLWLLAPFNPPLLATVLLVVASTAGALGAYILAGRLYRDWQPTGLSARIYRMLEHRGDPLTQAALRMLPGFPHSVVNYAGGTLKLPLPGFVIAAIAGLSIKWGVYASAVHGIADAVVEDTPIQFTTLLPLFALVVLALVGAWVKRRWAG